MHKRHLYSRMIHLVTAASKRPPENLTNDYERDAKYVKVRDIEYQGRKIGLFRQTGKHAISTIANFMPNAALKTRFSHLHIQGRENEVVILTPEEHKAINEEGTEGICIGLSDTLPPEIEEFEQQYREEVEAVIIQTLTPTHVLVKLCYYTAQEGEAVQKEATALVRIDIE